MEPAVQDQRNRLLHVALALLVLALLGVLVHRFHFLGDDCFIAFRFSKNLVDGHGLVYNPGERVEGYTQFLWVLLMAAGMKVGLQPEGFSMAVGITCGVLILLLLVRLSRGTAGGLTPWVWIAPLCLAVNRSFAAWCTGGLGTQFFAFLVLASAVCFMWARERNGSLVAASLLYGVTTLARPEGGLFFAVCGLFVLWDVLRRRSGFGALVRFTLPFVVLVGAHFLWRHHYYGFWLPNTFYAKVSGLWWDQSKLYLGLFANDHLLILSAPLLLLLLGRGGARHLLLAGQCVLYTLYIVYVGGDRFEYRFMTPVLPLYFWLLAESVRHAAEMASSRAAVRGVVGVIGALLVMATAARPLLVGFPPERVTETGVIGIEKVGEFAELRSMEGKFFKSLVEEGYLKGDELIATRGAGAMPYYSEFPILDLHGLNDVTIAHQEIQRRGVVSHEKVATLAYVRERGAVMCNVLNKFVFDERPELLMSPMFNGHHPYFPKPVRCIAVKGKYIVFGTTLSAERFRETFGKFQIIQ